MAVATRKSVHASTSIKPGPDAGRLDSVVHSTRTMTNNSNSKTKTAPVPIGVGTRARAKLEAQGCAAITGAEGLLTPPNSLSPALSPLNGNDEPQMATSKYGRVLKRKHSASQTDVTGKITPSLLAKTYLLKLMLNKAAMPIRDILAYLTTSVAGFPCIPAEKSLALLKKAFKIRPKTRDGKVVIFEGGRKGIIWSARYFQDDDDDFEDFEDDDEHMMQRRIVTTKPVPQAADDEYATDTEDWEHQHYLSGANKRPHISSTYHDCPKVMLSMDYSGGILPFRGVLSRSFEKAKHLIPTSALPQRIRNNKNQVKRKYMRSPSVMAVAGPIPVAMAALAPPVTTPLTVVQGGSREYTPAELDAVQTLAQLKTRVPSLAIST